MERDIKSRLIDNTLGLKEDLSKYIKMDLPCFDHILLYLQQYYYYPEKIFKFIKVNPVNSCLIFRDTVS